MAIQQTKDKFGKERAKRYRACMERCPTARYLEILPLLCIASGLSIESADVVDIGSGTGYLADFFADHAKTVLRVDKSEAMLKESGNGNYIVADMHNASSKIGPEKADLITCLAAFHHCHIPENPDPGFIYAQADMRHSSPERHLDAEKSLFRQTETIRDWASILRPGGILCLIDIPGYPDPAWNAFWQNKERYKINTRGYFEAIAESLSNWGFASSPETLEAFMKKSWPGFLHTDPHMKDVRSFLGKKEISMKALLDSYPLREDCIKTEGPMVPADFFDDVVDGYGAQRHFGYFLRETPIKETLEGLGMRDVHVHTLPTPWLFESEKEAAWFVHELFGLGETWDYDQIPKSELADLGNWLDQYLGFYKDQYGRTMLYWQLCYCYAIK